MSVYTNIPAQAAADAITVSASTGLSGVGTAGSPLAGVPASASAVGYESIANFNKLATLPTGSLLVGSYVTATIDLLAASAAYDFNTPLVTGATLGTAFVVYCHILTRNAAPTANLVVALAQSGVSIQGANSNITTGNTTPLAAPERVTAASITLKRPSMTTNPLQILIVTPFSGAGLSDCTGYFEVWASYQAS